MILETIEVGQLDANCYILAQDRGGKAVIIDPGGDAPKIQKVLEKYSLEPGLIINTHGHIDHIGADDKFNVPVYVHEADAGLLRDPQLNLSNFLMSDFRVGGSCAIKPLKEKELVGLPGLQLEVIHTPGHTPGGICLLLKQPAHKILFTGDTLFYSSIGRTDFPGASHKLLLNSIRDKLLGLPKDTVIYPGHGPSSTIGDEIENNPFLK